MLYSVALALGIASLVAVMSFSAITERGEKVRAVAAAVPLMLDLERYRSAQCNALPASATPTDLLSSGYIARDYADGIFDWIFEAGANNTASLVITSTDSGLLGTLERVFQSIDHPTLNDSIMIGIRPGPQMAIPDLHTNVVNELGATNVGCI
ncbi:MAG: hypothetical protein JKY40_10585 [Gammaproteobacteria bacterium]|nr:hypothetical protein [Gammaproteobacteria bacterium]MBL4729732.1 hypothetical protein [Gammaproteobacteria bacterium]